MAKDLSKMCPHHNWAPLFGGILILLGGVIKLLEAKGMVAAALANELIATLIILFGLSITIIGVFKCCSAR